MWALIRIAITFIICGCSLYTLANAQASTPGFMVFAAWIFAAISGAWAIVEIARIGIGG